MTAKRPPLTWTGTQRGIRFAVGLSLLIYEALLIESPRWELLVVYTAMMGLPLTNLADDLRVWRKASAE